MKNTIAVGEFKAKCLKLITKVHDSGQSIIITKRGEPYATVDPIKSSAESFTIFGCMKDSVQEIGDITKPMDVIWDAQK